ncbi:MAG: hypothetical protein ACOX5W_07075 [Bacillota bacterium]|jgi:hypothetical protein
MQSIIELLIIFLAIFVFLKFAGVCKKFTLSSGFKKGVYGLTAVGLIGLNVMAGSDLQLWMIIGGFVLVCLFTLALMSETQKA